MGNFPQKPFECPSYSANRVYTFKARTSLLQLKVLADFHVNSTPLASYCSKNSNDGDEKIPTLLKVGFSKGQSRQILELI
jgi:hypothetical protein